jgi:ABC-type nitrate/sulfonate/bicarbonate transport system substrate-binding protein
MTTSQPPVTVPDLLAKVKQATGNIDKHREAMAKVAADIAANRTQPPAGEVTKG